jgi:pyruvate/2-oxoglutarate dehydrogenase complex dihydrolipoamide dehydrogenase (E3) component
MSVEEYDLVILGGGTGSTVAAWTFAAAGQRVAVVERRYIGGSCPNIACLPSKNIKLERRKPWKVVICSLQQGASLTPKESDWS